VEDKNLSLSFPQIIVVGEESAGKSSVLERIAMISLFPRGQDITTRMPIRLQMKHMSIPQLKSFCETNQLLCSETAAYPRAKGMTADGREVWGRFFSTDNVEENVKRVMDENVRLKNNDVKGIIKDVLTIEITSNLVPNITLVDLPGIVGARMPGEPVDIAKQTTDLVESFMRQPHTLVLAVVSATTQSVRGSRGMGIIQDLHKEKDTIGVLTMADRAGDHINKDPFEKLKKRLLGGAGDCPLLEHGYVAVKNRDSRSGETLQQSAALEVPWFNANLPDCVERGVASSGALMEKLVRLLIEYVDMTWVPQAKKQLTQQKEATISDLKELGTLAENKDPFLRTLIRWYLEERTSCSFGGFPRSNILEIIEKETAKIISTTIHNSSASTTAKLHVILELVRQDMSLLSKLKTAVGAVLEMAKIQLLEDVCSTLACDVLRKRCRSRWTSCWLNTERNQFLELTQRGLNHGNAASFLLQPD